MESDRATEARESYFKVRITNEAIEWHRRIRRSPQIFQGAMTVFAYIWLTLRAIPLTLEGIKHSQEVASAPRDPISGDPRNN